jgi:hypothetical protein
VTDFSGFDGASVSNQDEEKLGKVTGLFADDELNVPTWVAVTSGLFGTHHALVPLAESRIVDGVLLVPYSRDDLATAPHHDPDVALTIEEEQLLFEHYNVGYGTLDTTGPHTGVDPDAELTHPHSGAHPVDPRTVEPAAGRLRRYAAS